MSCAPKRMGWTCPLAIVAIGFSLIAPEAFAQGANPEDNPLHMASREELDVIKVLLAQEKAWNKGDIDGFMQGFKESPETLFIARQVSKGYNEITAEYKHDYPNRSSMGQLGYSELEVHPLTDKFAICIGHYHLERSRKDGGSADGLFSLVLEETPQGWRIVVDHTT
jgi:ketosteroid isomerase-like protein